MKFRRQHQIGDYIVDFACAEYRLVIEVDGDIHKQPVVRAKDAEREKWLVAQGFRLLRFSNDQVMGAHGGCSCRDCGCRTPLYLWERGRG